MMEKIAEVEHLMAPILDGMQMRHLHAVLVSCFCEDGHVEHLGEDDARHCIAAFLAAKRLEGCSERTLGYYASTLNGFAGAVGKRMGAVTTDDIRDYLSEYQSAHGASNVTVDNVRRILSSFFSWLEAEDFIYKSPVKRPYENDFADTVEYEGGLLTLLRETQAFVKRHATESWEKTTDSRIERRSYSARAVEEVLVNALIHRSYLALGSEVHVDMYDDRMEVYSPGEKIGAPLPEDVVATRVKSERRSPVIADVFSRMNLMERRGSGLREICMATATEDAYKPEFKPLFESKQDAFWVTLWNMNYVEKAATDQVGTHDSPQVTPHVSPQVERLLAALGEGELTSAELMTAMGFSDRSSFQQNYLKAALESGLVEMTIPDKPKSRNQKYRRAK